MPLSHPLDHGSTGGPWRPPLGPDLLLANDVAEREIGIAKNPKLHHNLPLLRVPLGGRSVERELELLKGQGGPEREREFAAVRYYLRDLLFTVTTEWTGKTSGVTNYSPVIGEILRLNKDDNPSAWSPSTTTFSSIAHYTPLITSHVNQQFESHPVLKFFKPHGSVDWVRFVDIPSEVRLQPQHLIQSADTIQLLNMWATVGSPAQADNLSLGRTVFPAIAIPVQNKTHSTFECPASHLTYLKELLPQVTKILIIGWQASEAHFLEMLRCNPPRLRHLWWSERMPQAPGQR